MRTLTVSKFENGWPSTVLRLWSIEELCRVPVRVDTVTRGRWGQAAGGEAREPACPVTLPLQPHALFGEQEKQNKTYSLGHRLGN